MKTLNQSERRLNTVLDVLFWLLIARGIFSVGHHCLALYRLFTDPAAPTGTMGLTIDWLTLEAENGFGINSGDLISMKLIHLVSAIALTIISCRGIRVLKRILLPIEGGQPFRAGISGELTSLGRCALWLGAAENLSMLAIVILIENHYQLPDLLLGNAITGVSIHPQFRPAWFIVAAVLTILAMVFRRGEQLQQLSDETL